jgi:acetate CoA/acetoacetate CoA-transferase alpha subunit
MIANEMEVDLVPQGTLAERIRSAGAGLGGFLTPTGVGTIVEEGKEKMVINGMEYLLELPLKADVALIYAEKADKFGNLVYAGSKSNFNPLMATAADITIAEVAEVVEIGEINQLDVKTPGIFVTYIVNGGKN